MSLQVPLSASARKRSETLAFLTKRQARLADEHPLRVTPDNRLTRLPQTTATPGHTYASLRATKSPYLHSYIQKINQKETAHDQGHRRVRWHVFSSNLSRPSLPLRHFTPHPCLCPDRRRHSPAEDGRPQA